MTNSIAKAPAPIAIDALPGAAPIAIDALPGAAPTAIEYPFSALTD